VYTGLSISTVSRTLSETSYVKEETRQKVLEAVRILNYSPNMLAQGLKKGRSNTVVLMIPSIQNMIYPDETHRQAVASTGGYCGSTGSPTACRSAATVVYIATTT
jgi:DNA-binding LacI/PurR family transcriptional regulator